MNNKGQLKYVIGGFGILALVGVIIIMPKFQAVKEVKVSESVSNIYSITHAYERSQIANRETIESLLMNSSIELGKEEGGMDIEWDKIPDKKELKQNLTEDIKKKIENNGGRDNFFKTIYFKDGYMDTTIVGDDEYRMNMDSSGNLNIFLKSYCPKTVGSGDVSRVNFEKKYLLSVELPVNYSGVYDRVKEYISTLKKDYEDDQSIDFKKKNENFNKKNKDFNVTITSRNDPFNFSMIDLKNNVTYSNNYRPYMFNVSLELPGPSKPCVITQGKCKRGKECTLIFDGKSEDVEWIFGDEDIGNKKSKEVTVKLPDKGKFEVKLRVVNRETVVGLTDDKVLKEKYGSCS